MTMVLVLVQEFRIIVTEGRPGGEEQVWLCLWIRLWLFIYLWLVFNR